MTEKIHGNPGNPYDKFRSKNPILRKIMKKFKRDLLTAIRIANPKNIFDIGCGDGHVTKFIKDNTDVSIVGADLSPEIIRVAKNDYPDINFYIRSIFDTKEKTKSYDLVIASEILEHLKEPEKALKEMKRISKRYCLITVPNEPYFTLANISQLKHLKHFGLNPDHLQFWTKRSLHRMLNKHFKSVRIRTCFFWNIALCKK